ncbi:MAG: hypothetical protein ACRDJH_08280 [Thermomicrobiales bacterium]
MLSHIRNRTRRGPALLLALALLASLAVAPMASADTGTGTVSVTATNVESVILEVVIHDPTFTFGQICPQPVAVPCNPDPSAYHTTQGDAGSGQGVWWYLAPTAPSLVEVTSNRAWTGTVAASENSGTGASSSLTIASGALQYSGNTSLTPPIAYNTANGTFTTPFTEAGAAWPNATGGAAGTENFYHVYYLRSDLTDTAGSFNSTVTYTVTN